MLATALSQSLETFAADTSSDRPNILYVCADDLGYGELGCYGMKEVPTPNIDSIAANGIRFTSGYVSSPMCSPSRAGAMTGRYQGRYGHENNRMAPCGGLPLTETTLGQRMKALGYATGLVGKWHLGGDEHAPMHRGFDEFYGIIGNPGSYFKPHGFVEHSGSTTKRPVPGKDFYTTDAFGARAAQWIEEHKDVPWFLYLPFNAVHVPHEATPAYLDRFKHIEDRRRRVFCAMLAAMDDNIGIVLGKLRELKLEENTLIFFISDNGAPDVRSGNGGLRGGKHTCWEGGIRLPWLMQWKKRMPAGKVEHRAVIQLDVMPTCVAAAGGTVDPAWRLDGVNLLPYLTGENQASPHPTLYWRYEDQWAIRNGDMKLVHGQSDDDPPALFDLARDREEKSDLSAQQPETFKELKALWDRWNSELPVFVARTDKAGMKDE